MDFVWKSLLGGTAIISAVLAFAAQDVIKDILAGLIIDNLLRPDMHVNTEALRHI